MKLSDVLSYTLVHATLRSTTPILLATIAAVIRTEGMDTGSGSTSAPDTPNTCWSIKRVMPSASIFTPKPTTRMCELQP